jgi:hypothetical protein
VPAPLRLAVRCWNGAGLPFQPQFVLLDAGYLPSHGCIIAPAFGASIPIIYMATKA